MTSPTFVVKRNNTTEPLDINKIHFVIEEATAGLQGVSGSDIEMSAAIQFYDGIETRKIHELLIRASNGLISEQTPNYEIVSARLILSQLRKDVFGDYITPPLGQVINNNINAGVYDPQIVEWYSQDDIIKLDTHIDHKRDHLFKSAGLQQCIDKYLLKNRLTGELFETPQYMFMLISMVLFREYIRYGEKVRLKYVKAYYDAISTFKINLPTPILGGARTLIRQYSSCVKIDVGDTMDSILHSDAAIKKYTSQRAGIGINSGRIRSIGSLIRNGEVVHTGVIPYLKCFESSVRCCTQSGIRGGGATTFFSFWHSEIEDIIVLKNNKGNDENRVRKLDYAVQVNKLFYQRVINNQEITLFSPHTVPDLYESMGDNDVFEKLYHKYEKQFPNNTRVNARALFVKIVSERLETGRIYLMNIDHCNTHSSFLDTVYMSNLCVTGDTQLNVIVNGQQMLMSIKELVEGWNHIHDAQILSKNTINEEISYKQITNAALTAKSAKVMKITDLNTGKTIRCTPNHKIFTKNRGYIEAQFLQEDDVLDIL